MKKTAKPRKQKVINRFPKGWDEKRVRALLDHYENQSEEQAAREDARDAAIARRRLKDRKRKTIPLSKLKAQLGL